MTSSLQQISAQANNVLNGLTIAPQQGDSPDFETTQQLASQPATSTDLLQGHLKRKGPVERFFYRCYDNREELSE